jgi:hypothetical protein
MPGEDMIIMVGNDQACCPWACSASSDFPGTGWRSAGPAAGRGPNVIFTEFSRLSRLPPHERR